MSFKIRIYFVNSNYLQKQVDSPFGLDEKEFQKIYHLSRNSAVYLKNLLDTHLRGSKITTCSSNKLVCAALRFYATGCVEPLPFVSRAIQKVTDAINAKLCQKKIRFPMEIGEREAAKKIFSFSSTPFNGAIGAIGCMHVPITAPLGGQMGAYLNEHGYHSINVQMICDPNLKILNVNARYPGNKHNAYIWNASAARSVMNRAFDNGDHCGYLIGDAKYPLEPWLMTPIPNVVKESAEFRYNNALFEAQSCIQRLFFVLRTNWQCLAEEKILNFNPQFAGRIVNACSVLHNLQIERKEFDAQDFNDLKLVQDNCYVSFSTNSDLLNTAKIIRNRIVSNYYSKERK